MHCLTHTSTVACGNMSFRHGEKAEVLKNQTRFLAKLNTTVNSSIYMQSEHDDIITIIDDSKPSNPGGPVSAVKADSLITQLPDTPLLLTTADCLPVTLYDATTNTLALMHISRHTFCLDLIPKTIAILSEMFKVRINNLTVTIGPHIHKSSYTFPLPLTAVHPKLVPYVSYSDKRAYIDLARATTESIKSFGVSESNLQVSLVDTFTSKEHFSHVRSVQTGEPEGRMMTVAAIVS